MSGSRNTLLAVGAVVVLALGFYLLRPTGEQSVEEQIRNTLLQLRDAAQKRDLREVTDRIAEDFRTDEGLDKQSIKGVLAAQLLRGQWVRVFEVDVKITPTSATSGEVSGTWLFGRSDATDVRNLAAESVMGSYRIDARLEKRGEDWLVTWARYEQAAPFSP